MNNPRKPLPALIALGAALALPTAFAQDATTPTPSQTPPTQSPTGAPARRTCTTNSSPVVVVPIQVSREAPLDSRRGVPSTLISP